MGLFAEGIIENASEWLFFCRTRTNAKRLSLSFIFLLTNDKDCPNFSSPSIDGYWDPLQSTGIGANGLSGPGIYS